jgi:hypothetical protein
MKKRATIVAFFAIFLLATWQVASLNADDTFFEKQIRPLLVERCYECHSGTKNNGGLALDSRSAWQKGGESGQVILPGKPAESLLIQAINYQTLEMPPKDAGGKLSDTEIAALTKWVQDGAQDPRDEIAKIGGMSQEEAKTWWAFQPLPEVKSRASSEQLDAFIDDALAKESLDPNPPADRRTLIRRATYDLTGLPPTAEEVQAFLTDESPEAFATVIDRLLDSPQYGERWGRHWLDVVRYADTAGENTDRPLPHAWRYRNWVFETFNRDLPYDQFVQLQISGDILRRGSQQTELNEGIIATGYLAIARRFGHDIDKDIHLMHEDVIDNLGKNFLGLTIGCARCHDHKFDPITAEDYYALYGIFNSTRFSFPGCEPQGQPRDLVPLIPQAEADVLMNNWREQTAQVQAELQRRDAARLEIANSLKAAISQSSRLLAKAKVAEGAAVSFADAKQVSLERISVRKGETLLLTIFPNENHGADSTLVEWEIVDAENASRTWSVIDLIPKIMNGNPLITDDSAAWCFLEITDEAPKYLGQQQQEIDGHRELKSWRNDDTPSVFVNQSDQPTDVWTRLPPNSFFVHPGPNRPVAVAWIAPVDVVVNIQGRVMDAHPANLDGVAFELKHVASNEIGAQLVELGKAIGASEVSLKPAPVIPVAYAVAEATFANAPLQQRGDPEKPGDPVPRRWLSVFGGELLPADAGSGRLALANWVTQHPLFARVMVNRIWQWHFGQGLVGTSNDFGSRGEQPSHQELLDWLAAEFRASGYSLKSMHRLMMHSAAYQRSSNATESSVAIDFNNQLLARFSRRRLEAEEIRDSLLFVAGNLDPSPAQSHPFPPEASWGFTQHDPFNAVYETNRRSAYLMVQRQRRHPYLALFDGADPNSSTAIRQVTTVPTQALYFLNDPFFHEQATAVSQRMADLPSDNERIERIFQLLYQRLPTSAEFEQATHFLQQYPGSSQEKWAAYARVLLASNEFLYLD